MMRVPENVKPLLHRTELREFLEKELEDRKVFLIRLRDPIEYQRVAGAAELLEGILQSIKVKT